MQKRFYRQTLSENFQFLNFTQCVTNFSEIIQRLHAVDSKFVSLMFSSTYIACGGVFCRHHMNFLAFLSHPYVRDCLSETITTPLSDYYPILHYGPSTRVSSGPWEKLNWTLIFYIFSILAERISVHYCPQFYIYCPYKSENNNIFLLSYKKNTV